MLGRTDGGVQMLPLFEIDFSEMPADRPRIVSFEGKWVEASVEFRGTKPVPCAGLSAERRSAHRASVARARVRRHGAARLRPPGSAGHAGRDPLRHRRESRTAICRKPPADLPAPDAPPVSVMMTLIRRIVDLALQRRTHADTIPLAVRSRAAHRQSSRRGRASGRKRSRARSSCSTRALAPAESDSVRGAGRRRRPAQIPSACSATPASARRR